MTVEKLSHGESVESVQIKINKSIQLSTATNVLPAMNINASLSTGDFSKIIALVGDSTANEPGEWFTLGLQQFAEKYPKYSFIMSFWSDGNDCFEDPITYQAGIDGEARVLLNAASNQYGTLSNSAGNLNLTSDLDVAVKFSYQNIANITGEGVLLGSFQTSGNRSWAIGLGSNKRPFLGGQPMEQR